VLELQASAVRLHPQRACAASSGRPCVAARRPAQPRPAIHLRPDRQMTGAVPPPTGRPHRAAPTDPGCARRTSTAGFTRRSYVARILHVRAG
jgi:hypothetical protein